MNILIVYANPEPKSFQGAMMDVAVETLTDAGHHVVVSDLYTLDFNPVAGPGDIEGERADPDFFVLQKEQTSAYKTGTLASDIATEIEKLRAADFVILQFPIWWFGMPAILKGWADRVFVRGFAYMPGRRYDTGMLKGKLGMVAITTGTSADPYAPDGLFGDMATFLWPIHNGLLRYTGFDVLPPFIASMPGQAGQAARRTYLEGYRKRLSQIDTTPRLFFHPAGDYGPDERLKPNVLARSGVQRNV